MCMSALFANANTATSMSGLIWFISYTPFIFLAINNVKIPWIISIVLCILPNVAMAYGCRIIVELEAIGDGLRFNSFFNSTASESGLSVGIVMCLMLISSIAFIFATFYFERVFPESAYAIPEKWDFIFKKEFWSKQDEPQDYPDEERAKLKRKYFERNITDCEPVVELINLRKEFEGDKVACKDLTFEMYRDQITVLLGNDGCGKSTTVKMLTGMIPPTAGTVIIDGFDIRKDRENARRSIGICPQHNILLDELTAREQIEFFGRLKGLSRSDAKKEMKKYVELLNLRSIINKCSSELSDVLQRKIMLCIALCGGSKVILCDELTGGCRMDPLTKRELWSVLDSEKIGRTIILTTNFVDEADIVGDRIAIMADGELKCGGSPFFLKRRFNDGYRLTCAKQEDCESSRITKILRKYIPEIEVHEEVNTEVSYILPYDQKEHFPQLFGTLEKQLKSLDLFTFGVTAAELEEVFLKLGTDKTNEIRTLANDDNVYTKFNLAGGVEVYIYQCCAMLKKRFYCWTNNWKVFLGLHILLMCFIVFSILFFRMSSSYSLPLLDITLNSYDDTVTLLRVDSSPVSNLTER